MRVSCTYNAKEPQSKNELMEMIKNKEDVIIISHSMLEELAKDINNDMKFKKKSKRHAIASIALLALASNPIGWITGGLGLLLSCIEGDKNRFDEYNLYQGNDISLKQILTLHLKETVDLKHDKIIYPRWVSKIESEKINHIK